MELKKIRLMTGKTQSEVAKAIGLTQFTYSNYETGKTQPDFETIINLANYFNTTTDNILGHNVPYLLDKSTLTEEQKQIIDVVTQMNYEECKIMLAYIEGVKKGIQERNAKFSNFERNNQFGNTEQS